ncbi:MAG: hypothetical protein R3314_03870 [Longimicrobiales bacterium]|nr:hypothetical protein [Longimicrobiales bacterium]
MPRLLLSALVALGTLALGSALPEPAAAQETVEVGAEAPDFSLPGATRYGVLADSVRLSDYIGETVVLAFFFRARTRG